MVKLFQDIFCKSLDFRLRHNLLGMNYATFLMLSLSLFNPVFASANFFIIIYALKQCLIYITWYCISSSATYFFYYPLFWFTALHYNSSQKFDNTVYIQQKSANYQKMTNGELKILLVIPNSPGRNITWKIQQTQWMDRNVDDSTPEKKIPFDISWLEIINIDMMQIWNHSK